MANDLYDGKTLEEQLSLLRGFHLMATAGQEDTTSYDYLRGFYDAVILMRGGDKSE